MTITGSRKPILELRHIECEPPGGYLPVLEQFGPLHTVRSWEQPIPENPHDFAAIVVMGGPMGANDGATLPWIDEEIEFLRRAVVTDVAVWGVCLGAQLLAAALGAEVWTGPQPEVGVVEISLTHAVVMDPVWAESVSSGPMHALQWHSDTFAVPGSATLIGSTAAYPSQLFRYGKSYGVQFHLEATAELAKQWLEVSEYRTALESAIGAEAIPGFISAIAAVEASSAALAGATIGRWLNIAIDRDMQFPAVDPRATTKSPPGLNEEES